MTTEDEKQKRSEQFKEFEMLKNISLNQSNNLDKNLITLSSASVGLIVSVLLDKNEANIITLKFSLICFAITIVSTVLSFYFSIKAHQNDITALNDEILENPVQKRFNWNLPIDITTNVSVTFFLIGVLSLLYAYL